MKLEKIKLIDQGVIFIILSAFFSALSGAVAKVLSESMDPIEMVFYRNILGVMIILYSFKKMPVHINT